MSHIIHGDALTVLRDQFADESVQCCVTSPPYWGLRDYGVDGQLGLENTPELYVAKMVEVFREVRRVIKDDGTLWLNLGDSYAGSWGAMSHSLEHKGKRTGYTERPAASYKQNGIKPKDLVGIPWRLAFALQADGWYLRSDIIWSKPNPMPESVTDRPTKAHEYMFLMSKSERYYYDADAIAERAIYPDADRKPYAPGQVDARGNGHDRRGGRPGGRKPEKFDEFVSGAGISGIGENKSTRNKRTVWTVATSPYADAHFATFPPKLIEPCILAGCPSGGLVLDPFAGSGTTLMVAQQLGRQGVGIELNEAYIVLASQRTAQEGLPL